MRTMRIAVAGATGNIGRRVVCALERTGHVVVRISRSLGVDLFTGEGLDDALVNVEAVIDASNYRAVDTTDATEHFATTSRNLLAAEDRAGVLHHVLLSIVGIGPIEGVAHYAGKREQERLVVTGPVPWTIVPVTQFHDFAASVVRWTEHEGTATVPPLLVQPVAPDDVAEILVEIVTNPPQGRHRDVAGPETQDLVDMARRTSLAQGRSIRIVPTWSAFGTQMAGNVLLPNADARITSTTFEEWLSQHR